MKSRGFKFKPIYFDAEKAEFKERVEKLRRERDQIEAGDYRPNFKGKFTSQIGKKSAFQKQMAAYNLRLLLILIGIGIAAYFLYNSNQFNSTLEQFFEIFNKKDGLY